MFTYWRGYEIDGSSTTYNIVFPDQKMYEEVLRYFINLKIINRDDDIYLSILEVKGNGSNIRHTKECYKADDIDKICEFLKRPPI